MGVENPNPSGVNKQSSPNGSKSNSDPLLKDPPIIRRDDGSEAKEVIVDNERALFVNPNTVGNNKSVIATILEVDRIVMGQMSFANR